MNIKEGDFHGIGKKKGGGYLMKRTMYYKTKWSEEHYPFICTVADKIHYPEIEIWLETPRKFKPIQYKKIDELMYETRKATYEKLASNIAKGLLKILKKQHKKGEIIIKVKILDDREFYIEVVIEKRLK